MSGTLLRGALAGLAVLAAAAPASAGAETIGTKILGGASYGGQCGSGMRGLVHDGAYAESHMPGGLTADADGVITRWRFASVEGPEEYDIPIALKTYDRTGGNTLIARRQSDSFDHFPPDGSEISEVTVPSRLAIEAGQTIGYDLLAFERCVPVNTTAPCGEASDTFGPPLALGMEGTASQNAYCIYLNADIEPDADKDGYGDVSQDLCPSIKETQIACLAYKRQQCAKKSTRLRRKLCRCKLKPTKAKRRTCRNRARAHARRN